MKSFTAYYFIFGYGVLLQLATMTGLYFTGFVPASLVCSGILVLHFSWSANGPRLKLLDILLVTAVASCILLPFAYTAVLSGPRVFSLVQKLTHVLWPMIIGLGGAHLVRQDTSALQKVAWIYGCLIIVSLCFSLAIPFFSSGTETTAYRIGAEANSQSYAVAVCSFFLLLQCLLTSKVNKLIALSVGATIGFILASRGALASYLISSGVYLCVWFPPGMYRKRARIPKMKLKLIICLIVVLVPLMAAICTAGQASTTTRLLSPPFAMAQYRWNRLASTLHQTGSLLGLDRIQYLKKAREVVECSPLFGDFGYTGQDGTYAHNTWYDALAQLGIPCGSMLLAVCAAPMWLFIRLGPFRSTVPSWSFLFLVYLSDILRGFATNTLMGEARFWFVTGVILSTATGTCRNGELRSKSWPSCAGRRAR